MNRRTFSFSLTALLGTPALAKECLPQSSTFLGEAKFKQLINKAQQGNWSSLPIGERVAKFGLAMVGTPYVGYTLEIDDYIESPSANFTGLDCWTFFEIALGLARMVERKKGGYDRADLLAEIAGTRYRAGICNGNYLDRIHYLSEWYFDNAARGNIAPMTTQIAATERIRDRKIQEMTVLWKGYRYLRKSPELLPAMAAHEARIAAYNFQYIPKSRVAEIEDKIQSGDIIGIVTNQSGSFCSHVGLAIRSADGITHFMHASKNHHEVVVDDAIHTYLNRFKYHAGIIVGRPLPLSAEVKSGSLYAKRLRELTR